MGKIKVQYGTMVFQNFQNNLFNFNFISVWNNAEFDKSCACVRDMVNFNGLSPSLPFTSEDWINYKVRYRNRENILSYPGHPVQSMSCPCILCIYNGNRIATVDFLQWEIC